ncbi:FAD-binding monooxygenase, putative [Babesia ovata]|uniref:FAD-binding monooxygenase, putative n=1 Tax=Babesia ovata TaxID=189622 RepID=A0A2H6K7H5_9APIC|nr:FAD-binding monooxygenase, putative [Babesia ovata]GBE58946.1 FAD-binding monooxygenase, putative [Babesia ovata]
MSLSFFGASCARATVEPGLAEQQSPEVVREHFPERRPGLPGHLGHAVGEVLELLGEFGHFIDPRRAHGANDAHEDAEFRPCPEHRLAQQALAYARSR